ncbi:hypothetical protein JTB14_022586 [Gonioctena quinquepunctata]|nr:hypothetical protein JTB14_022586 [Gonioctena quinquepunctata]
MNNPKTKQKRKYCGWTPEDMERALTAYKEKQCGFNGYCRRYNTFRRHLRCLNKKPNEKVQSMGRLTVFIADIGRELADHILKLEEIFFGVTISPVRHLTFHIAVRNNIPHNLNMNKQMAGKAWYYSFMRRHDFLSLRQPEKISMARASGFNKQNVYEFFNILGKCVDENGFTALTIFNIDESVFSMVQKKNHKIIAKTYFSQAVKTFLRTNPGSTVLQYNMTALLSDAFAKTATISTIANDLKKHGICPVDRTVFAETDFIAASILLEKESNNNYVSEHSNQADDNQNQMDVRELGNTENGQ